MSSDSFVVHKGMIILMPWDRGFRRLVASSCIHKSGLSKQQQRRKSLGVMCLPPHPSRMALRRRCEKGGQTIAPVLMHVEHCCVSLYSASDDGCHRKTQETFSIPCCFFVFRFSGIHSQQNHTNTAKHIVGPDQSNTQQSVPTQSTSLSR